MADLLNVRAPDAPKRLSLRNRGVRMNYQALFQLQQSKKPNLVSWAKCLIILVPAAGIELAT